MSINFFKQELWGNNIEEFMCNVCVESWLKEFSLLHVASFRLLFYLRYIIKIKTLFSVVTTTKRNGSQTMRLNEIHSRYERWYLWNLNNFLIFSSSFFSFSYIGSRHTGSKKCFNRINIKKFIINLIVKGQLICNWME